MNKNTPYSHKELNPILIGSLILIVGIIFLDVTITFGTGMLAPTRALAQATPPPPPPPPLPPPLSPIVSPIPTCTLSANPTSLASGGGSSMLSWTTIAAISAAINNGAGDVSPVNAGSQAVFVTATTNYTMTVLGPGGQTTCSVEVSVASPPAPATSVPPPSDGGGGGSSGGGGGGGGSSAPNVTLTLLPHVGFQPLVYLYLSQIPYTGLDLGPIGTALYWLALVGFALALAYLILFGVVPLANRSFRSLSSRVKGTLNVRESLFAASRAAPTMVSSEPILPPPAAQEPREAPRGYSPYVGFKSFAHNGALSIEDIVKGLARNVEPIYENVEPIVNDIVANTASVSAPMNTRDFISALVRGDRDAVFAGLRQRARGTESPEQLISAAVCLLDDAYRARIDGADTDTDIARLIARLDTPTLEKLISALTTAIDSRYSVGMTGVKLALTRALTVLGA